VIHRLEELLPYVDAIKIEGRSKSEFYVGSVVKAYKHMRDSLLEGKQPDPNIVDLVNKIPHRPYWDGFLFHELKDFPEGEDDSSQAENSTTLDSAGPMFNRNFFGVVTDKSIEVEGRSYLAINPKEVLQAGMTLLYISPDSIGTLEIQEVRDAKGNQLEKGDCNSGEVYIATDKNLQGWEILYM
jgi:putative protease